MVGKGVTFRLRFALWVGCGALGQFLVSLIGVLARYLQVS